MKSNPHSRLTADIPSDVERFLVRRTRNSELDKWGIQFATEVTQYGIVLTVHTCTKDEQADAFDEGLERKDIIVTINGLVIGSSDLDSVKKVVTRLGQEIDVLFEVARRP